MKPLTPLTLALAAAAARVLAAPLPAGGGFHIDPALPDGHYRIGLRAGGDHDVRRWHPGLRRWQRLVRRRLGRRHGTGEYTFLVDDAAARVDAVSLDLFGAQHLPLPVKSQVSCAHHRDYNTLGYPLRADDYYASKLGLFNYCNVFQFVEGYVSMALNGSVAVYVCQRHVTTLHLNTCAEAEFKAAEALLNQSCGATAGYVFIPDWNKEYGRMWKGEYACRRWGDFKYNTPAQFIFHQLKGAGRITDEPKGLRPPKSAEQLLNETLWEPQKLNEADDTGHREDHSFAYGQFEPGWVAGWPPNPPVRYLDDKTNSLTGVSEWKDDKGHGGHA